MFNKIFKLILSTISISYAIYQITLDNLGNGLALIFLGLIFILLYFKNEKEKIFSLLDLVQPSYFLNTRTNI